MADVTNDPRNYLEKIRNLENIDEKVEMLIKYLEFQLSLLQMFDDLMRSNVELVQSIAEQVNDIKSYLNRQK
jgi:hypothetical protein